MRNELVFKIKNNFSELAKVAGTFHDFSKKIKLPQNVSQAIDLTLDEILNNIILYGYEDQNEHFIDISISVEDDTVCLEIVDDGRKFNPLDAPQPDTKSALEARPVGGLGIHLIRNVMDEIHYTYKNNRNYLVMKKKFKET